MSAYQQLSEHFTHINHLQHIYAICHWDEAVMMPPGGGLARAKAIATLNTVMHQLLGDNKVKDLIKAAKQEDLADPWQQANLRLIEKAYLNASCLPESLVRKKSEAASRCEQAWRKLRAENNWQDFAPLLAENFKYIKEANKIRADILEKNCYDVAIDDYSPELTQAIIDPIFAELKAVLPDLIQTTLAKQANRKIIALDGDYPIERQKQLAVELMQAIGFDFNHGRLDVSHHPFCGGVPQDVRITTRYRQDEFVSAVMGICHESGHAMYERQLPEQWQDQPVGHALGMAMHESQSLITEMQACRSREFMQFMQPQIQQFFGDQPGFAAENLYQNYITVRPGYIRVDADELTYPLHVILRYEIEKKLFNDDITIDDLPAIWQEKMQAYLNIDTSNNYKDGVMQDVHWPAGIFGYFPAYTIGALIAAQLYQAAVKVKPDIPENLTHGNFQPLMTWLADNIHQQGSSMHFNDIIAKASGEKLSATYFLNHIHQRYLNSNKEINYAKTN